MSGAATDNNAKLFAQGYNGVLNSHFSDGSYVKVGAPPGTWDPPTAATEFEQQFTAHPNINAVVTPNDDNANAVISVLLKNKVKADTFPTTGQDAAPTGLQNILKGYQCGTVYKLPYAEPQAAAALALFLRAGKTPPSSLVNATTKDTTLNADIKSVYTKPVWVTKENMEEWKPEEVQAHLDYYKALSQELRESGELVQSEILTGPDLAKIVTSDGTTPVVTDGPFQEFKEWLAGFQVFDVESEERALEIAARLSAVPGPDGVATQQPIQVRRVMDDRINDTEGMKEYLETAAGER